LADVETFKLKGGLDFIFLFEIAEHERLILPQHFTIISLFFPIEIFKG
jgi:hypothetical protein